MFVRGLHSSHHEALSSMKQLYCPDCKDWVDTFCEDNSFDHEFGVEWLFDYKCDQCSALLKTEKKRPDRRDCEPE